MIDETHDAGRRSWVASANGHADFPIQNLPLGIFTPPEGGRRRAGVAIGEMILDLRAAGSAGHLPAELGEALAGETLNALFALGETPRRALRTRLFELLSEGSRAEQVLSGMLHPAARCTLHLPAEIGDYTDFYVGIHHASNVGRLLRPDNPLLPNYKYVPIAYHGRASSVVPSGARVTRPNGQRKPQAQPTPDFGPCRNLDYELELGIWIGRGNALGVPVPIAEAASHIGGFSLLNDWSARDVQAWEYQPLGPFLAKNFGTTVSPWVVTPEALAPFRAAAPPRAAGDPALLAYLDDAADQREGGLALELEVLLLTSRMRKLGLPPARLALSSTRHMYWTVAQMLAHHTSNGCNLCPGDLFGSGTISAPDAGGFGSLLEATEGGKRPVSLASGEERRFLADGDEVILRARGVRDGFAAIGFGDCRGTVLPAPPAAVAHAPAGAGPSPALDHRTGGR